MAKKYTREELEALKRFQLRTVATEQCGMPDLEAGSLKASQMIDYILKKQGGKAAPVEEDEGEEVAEERPRGRGRPPGRKAVPKEEPEEEPEEKEEEKEEDEEEAPRGRRGPAPKGGVDKLDAIGKEIDKNHEELMDGIRDINQVAYLLFNLLGDIYGEHFDPGEFEKRTEKLKKAFQGK